MHLRRIACVLLGAWLTGSIVVGWVATTNFGAADRVLASPPLQLEKAIAPDRVHARMTLRYLVATENAEYFVGWELAEFALLLCLAAILGLERHTRVLATLPAGALLLVAFQHFRVTPEIIWLGQAMVLAGGSADPQTRSQFGTMHKLYGALEVLKLLIAVILGVFLITMRSRRRTRRAPGAEESAEPLPHRHFAR